MTTAQLAEALKKYGNKVKVATAPAQLNIDGGEDEMMFVSVPHQSSKLNQKKQMMITKRQYDLAVLASGQSGSKNWND